MTKLTQLSSQKRKTLMDGVEKLVAVIDTRERTPFNLKQFGLKSITGTLKFGDYSLIYPDLREIVTIERKSLADFVYCCGKERPRFEREIKALCGYRYKAIIVEASMHEIAEHAYQSKTLPQCVIGSMAKWTREGIPIWFCENDYYAAYYAASFLCNVGRDIMGYVAPLCKDYKNGKFPPNSPENIENDFDPSEQYEAFD